jgi:hypothetical protein
MVAIGWFFSDFFIHPIFPYPMDPKFRNHPVRNQPISTLYICHGQFEKRENQQNENFS